MTVTLTESAVNAESRRMMRLQIIIDEVSKRAEDSDLAHYSQLVAKRDFTIPI